MDIKRQYNEIEWLSDYIDNRLSLEEKSAFEQMLEKDGRSSCIFGIVAIHQNIAAAISQKTCSP